MTKIKPVRIGGLITKQGVMFALKYLAVGVVIALVHAVLEVRV
jgi:hypothetical protein